MIMLLIQHGTNIDAKDANGHTVLHRAALLGNTDIVSALVNRGAIIGHIADNHTSLLYIAAETGNENIAKIALENQEASEALVRSREISLHKAANCDHIKVMEQLFEYGVDVDSEDDNGYTALHIAIRRKRSDAAVILIEKGADLEAKQMTRGWTPLFHGIRAS